MLILQNISYIHPNKDQLLRNINLSVQQHEKIALTGNNGAGKSTLLRIMAGELSPSAGRIMARAEPYYVPQLAGRYDHLTVAGSLQAGKKIAAVREVLRGNVTQEYLDLIGDDWDIEDRFLEAMARWELSGIGPDRLMGTLSGGQKTKVLLAGIEISKPQLILLDEPGNHLDAGGRAKLRELIGASSAAMLIVSHDRELLRMPARICELSSRGITVYGGNYDFYAEQKQAGNEALEHDIRNKEKALRKAREKEKDMLERRQRADARGKGRQEKAGTARIMMNTLRNQAENSTSRLKDVHSEKIGGISRELHELRSALPDIDKMKLGFGNAALHNGKMICSASGIQCIRLGARLWEHPLTFGIRSGERIAISGPNGSGKTTLARIILGKSDPDEGSISRSQAATVYLDQDYSMLDDSLSVFGQAAEFATAGLPEHEIRTRLSHFLFGAETLDKPCSALSGGERMRLALCCLTMRAQSPDIMVLDEPTNNLDLQNVAILTAAVNAYRGTLIVISHDLDFLRDTGIERSIGLQ